MWLSLLIRIIGGALLVDLVAALLRPSPHPATPESDGSFRIGPTVGARILVIVGAMLCLGPLAFFPFMLLREDADVPAALMTLIFPLLTFPLGYYSLLYLSASVRYGAEGITFNRFFRQHFVSWGDVTGITDTPGISTHIQTRNTRHFVSKRWKGFPQFLEELQKRGVSGAGHRSLEVVDT